MNDLNNTNYDLEAFLTSSINDFKTQLRIMNVEIIEKFSASNKKEEYIYLRNLWKSNKDFILKQNL